MVKYHRHKKGSGKEYYHPVTRKHKKADRVTFQHKHKLPSGKIYWHSKDIKHKKVKRVTKKVKEKVIPKRLRKPVYRITLGKSYHGITEKTATPSPFLTIYVWVFTRNPEKYSETAFKNDIETINHNLFIDWGTKHKMNWEDNVESDYTYNLSDLGVDVGSFTGFETHRVDDDEIYDEDIVHKSALFYGEGGSVKAEFKF